jgi:hypothetical protein
MENGDLTKAYGMIFNVQGRTGVPYGGQYADKACRTSLS